MLEAAVESWPRIPIVMHQDHGASPAVCQASIRSGFTSVMMDGSLGEDMKTPASYEYNVDVTRKVVGMAGEEDGSGAEGKLSHDQLLTDPEQAADFVKQTGVDALAKGICRARFEAFGCAGRASTIKPVALDKLAERYQ